MAASGFTRLLIGLKRALFGDNKKPKATRPPDPRIDTDPWLALLFDVLGDRYRLGDSKAHGLQVLCRTGRERFNAMRVYLQPTTRIVATDYDVRIRDGKPLDEGRALLARKIGAQLTQWGLRQDGESVEEWGGHVLTLRYHGECADPQRAAEAIRFMCQHSEHVLDTAME